MDVERRFLHGDEDDIPPVDQDNYMQRCQYYTHFFKNDKSVDLSVLAHAFFMILSCWFLIPKGAFNHGGHHKPLQIAGSVCVYIGILALLFAGHTHADNVHEICGWILIVLLSFQVFMGVSAKWFGANRLRPFHRKTGKPLAVALAINTYLGLLLAMGADQSPVHHSNRQKEAIGHTLPAIFFTLWAVLMYKSDLKREPLKLMRQEAYLFLISGGLYVLGDFILSPLPDSPMKYLRHGMGHNMQTHVGVALLIIVTGYLILRFSQSNVVSHFPQAALALVYGMSMLLHTQESTMSTMLHKAHALLVVLTALFRYTGKALESACTVFAAAVVFVFSQEAFVEFAICANVMVAPWIVFIISFCILVFAVHGNFEELGRIRDGGIPVVRRRTEDISSVVYEPVGRMNMENAVKGDHGVDECDEEAGEFGAL